MSFVYLHKDGAGIPYGEERLRGIAHEMYCIECTSKNNSFNDSMATIYNSGIVQHPQTGEKALQIDIDASLPHLPQVFSERLETQQTMEENGWFINGQ